MVTNIENRRNVFRIKLAIDMCGEVFIYKLNENVIRTNLSKVCIVDISAGGVQFKSKLNFPNKNISYKVLFEIYNVKYEIECILKWKKENRNGTFNYGAMFCQTKDEQEKLIKIMTRLSVQIKRLDDGIYKYCRKDCLK